MHQQFLPKTASSSNDAILASIKFDNMFLYFSTVLDWNILTVWYSQWQTVMNIHDLLTLILNPTFTKSSDRNDHYSSTLDIIWFHIGLKLILFIVSGIYQDKWAALSLVWVSATGFVAPKQTMFIIILISLIQQICFKAVLSVK